MWARTLCPLVSSTRNIAFGRASTTVPSISITPSFFGMSSAIRSLVFYRRPGNLPAGAGWTSWCRIVNLFPGAHPRSGERTNEGPGSREAPRNRPTLGRRASLVRNGPEPLIRSPWPEQPPQRGCRAPETGPVAGADPPGEVLDQAAPGNVEQPLLEAVLARPVVRREHAVQCRA